jgi:hypothetical protein
MNVSGFIQFHISIGWTGVAFGFLALALRVPDVLNRWWGAPPCMRRTMEMLHSLSGGVFIACSIFMPITANWIWPRFGTPKDVVWFITTMFLAMLLGIVCIRLRRFLLLSHSDEKLDSANTEEADRCASSLQVGNDGGLPLAVTDGALDSSDGNELSAGEGSSAMTVLIAESSNKKYIDLALKYFHALFMTYSLVMLLGAGQAFLANSRMNQFPYPPDEIVTDSLIGRCYGRNLVEPSAPSWLTELACGLTSFCQESSRGGPNSYYHENGFI